MINQDTTTEVGPVHRHYTSVVLLVLALGLPIFLFCKYALKGCSGCCGG